MPQVRGPSGWYQDGSWKPWGRLWGMGLGWLVGIGCNGEQTPAGTLPKRVPILPPPPPTPAAPPHPLPCCLRTPAGNGLSFPTFPKRGGRTANFTPECQAGSQDTSTASCPSTPVPSHPPPAPPSDVAIKTSAAVKRLMRVGGGGGGEGSGSHEPGPRLIQPP